MTSRHRHRQLRRVPDDERVLVLRRRFRRWLAYTWFPDLRVLQVTADRRSHLAAMVSFENPEPRAVPQLHRVAGISPAGQASNNSGGTEFFSARRWVMGSRPATRPRARIASVSGRSQHQLDRLGHAALKLSNKLIEADTYTLPAMQRRRMAPTPLCDCAQRHSALFERTRQPERSRLLVLFLRSSGAAPC